MKDGPSDLVYVSDDEPGYSRKREGDTFAYACPEGRPVTDITEMTRIDALGIPPAWRDVWICRIPEGYLQATGLDDKGRKQYRYHDDWRTFRERKKFAALPAFGRALPKLRRQIRTIFREHETFTRELAIAAIIRLIDNAPLRIGSRGNRSQTIGASTLCARHVTLSSDSIRLDYTAKGGKRVRRQIQDKNLMRILEAIDDLPGRDVFNYVGDDGAVHPLRSEHVNDWLKAVSDNDDITAKTFRIWAGSLKAFEAAIQTEKLTIKAMCSAAAKHLRNTPIVARNSYVHPAIIALKDCGRDERRALLEDIDDSARDLSRSETAMLGVLENATE